MNKFAAAAVLGLCTLTASSAIAIPLGVPRERVRLGELTSIDNVVIYNKPVVLPDGEYLGFVENVEYVGTIVTQVKVSMNGFRDAAWLFRERVKYDPDNDVVVALDSRDRIERVSFLNF